MVYIFLCFFFFAHASLPVRDACLGVSWLHIVHCVLALRGQQLAESLSLDCSCLTPVEQMLAFWGSQLSLSQVLVYSLQVLCIGDGH